MSISRRFDSFSRCGRRCVGRVDEGNVIAGGADRQATGEGIFFFRLDDLGTHRTPPTQPTVSTRFKPSAALETTGIEPATSGLQSRRSPN